MRQARRVGLLFLALASLAFSPPAADPLAEWTLRNPSPTANQLWSVIFHDHLFVAVGDAGEVLTSPNASDWTVQSTPTYERLRSVMVGAGLLVAVGDSGTILTSSDGSNWTRTISGTDRELHGVVYGNGTFVAVGKQGVILTSPNGSSWTKQPSGTTADLESIAFGNGQFVVGGGYYIPARFEGVLLVSSDGIHWTDQTPGNRFQVHYSSVAYDQGTFVAMSSSGYLSTSTDATVWTPPLPVNPPAPSNRTNHQKSTGPGYPSTGPQPLVTFLNSRLFVIWPSDELRSSTEGSVWARNLAASNVAPLSSAAYGDGQYVVTARGAILTSLDGTNWINRVRQRFGDLSFVGYANTNFITDALQSPDGTVWTTRPLLQISPSGLAKGNGLWVAVGSSSLNVLTSTDGITWQLQPVDTRSHALNGIAYGNNVFVAVGGDASFDNVVLTSADGRDWQAQTITNLNGLTGIAFGNGRFVAVSPNRGLATSLDGTRWTVQPMAVPAVGYDIRTFLPHGGIAFGSDRFVILGAMGGALTALYSADGLNWTKSVVEPTGLKVGAIAFGNGYFAAPAADEPVSVILTSHNGIHWKKHPLRTRELLFDITFGADAFVAVGESAAIYQSAPVLSPYEVSITAEFDAFVPGTEPGLVRITRLGRVPLDVDLFVRFALGGTAQSGVDFVALSNSAVIPAGFSFVEIPVFAQGSPTRPGTKTLTFSLQPGEAYNLGVQSSAVVSLVSPGPAPRLRRGSIQAKDEVVSFTIDCLPWASLSVESTSDWRQWTPLRTVTAPGTAVEIMEALDGDNQSQRFYRAKLIGP